MSVYATSVCPQIRNYVSTQPRKCGYRRATPGGGSEMAPMDKGNGQLRTYVTTYRSWLGGSENGRRFCSRERAE